MAVVVDPMQSVKGKVVIDAFRLINPQTVHPNKLLMFYINKPFTFY